jgi:hypothetical protein
MTNMEQTESMRRDVVELQKAVKAIETALKKYGSAPGSKVEGPLNTKEPANDGGGRVIECPPGHYASKFQFVKDGDQTQSRSINVWFAPLPEFSFPAK